VFGVRWDRILPRTEANLRFQLARPANSRTARGLRQDQFLINLFLQFSFACSSFSHMNRKSTIGSKLTFVESCRILWKREAGERPLLEAATKQRLVKIVNILCVL
jgi:hypothetical protein